MSAGRDALSDLGPAMLRARTVRYLEPSDFDDVDEDDLGKAARNLRALSYSCQRGAVVLEAIVNRRNYERRAAAAEETST